MATPKDIEACSVGRELASIGHNLLATTQNPKGLLEAADALKALAGKLLQIASEASQG